MNIYPAIDLKEGKCVRLYQGRYDKVTVYEKDPVELAKFFAEQGATFLHIVDLDGAKQGALVNLDIAVRIANESGLKIQFGGGIRIKQQIDEIISRGIFRVVLGSVAILSPCLVKRWLQEFGCEKIVLALDIRMDEKKLPKISFQGWQISSNKNLWELLNEYQDSPLKHVLCTDIEQDGTLQGPNFDLYLQCIKRYPNLDFQASGGVGCINDLCDLAVIPVSGAIVGKAFYEQKFSLSTAFIEVAKC